MMQAQARRCWRKKAAVAIKPLGDKSVQIVALGGGWTVAS
jgi:hypothetical protein